MQRYNHFCIILFMALYYLSQAGLDFSQSPEEVRHGDVTTGVKRAWNVITAGKTEKSCTSSFL